jgi:hypothetical protein
LIALSDYVGLAEIFHDFVSFVTHDSMMQPVIYQGCTPIITWVQHSKYSLPTSHGV